MGLLKNVVKNGISNAISKGVDGVASGISKGISDAVGAAVQKNVAPAADKLAGKAAEKINETAESVSKAMDETAAAANELSGSMAEAASQASSSMAEASTSMAAAAAGMEAAPAQSGGLDSLAGSLSGLMGALENAAAEMASGIKVCPKCGEGAPAGTKFCPKCGTALPEKTIGEMYICPKCGKKNLPETSFCVECGTILPAAEQAMADIKAKDEAILANWNESLGAYPVWNGGGNDFELETNGEDNGYPVYLFSAAGVDAEGLEKYVKLLEENGFVKPEGFSSPEVLYKVIDGVCRAFSQTEALAYDRMSIGFYVGDYNKPKPAEKSKGDSLAEGVVAAKKVLGKLFG